MTRARSRCLVLLSLPALAASRYYPTTDGLWSLVNDASRVSGDAIQLTQSLDNSKGAAWYGTAASVAAFEATFDFRISNNAHGYAFPADGICFVVQSSGGLLAGSSGGGIGYQGIAEVGAFV